MILLIIISVQHRTLEFRTAFRDWQRLFGRFSLSVFTTSGRAFRDTQDMVQRGHDETDHGRNSEHYYENAFV